MPRAGVEPAPLTASARRHTIIAMEWRNGRLGLRITDSLQTADLVNLSSKREIVISLRRPRLDFGEIVWPGGESPADLTREDTPEGPRWTGTYAPAVVSGVELQATVWLQAYRDRPYVRKGYELVLNGSGADLPFHEIEMDRVDLAGLSPEFYSRGDQSVPILSDSFFLGVEFPISCARLEVSTAILASRPGIYLAFEKVFKTRDTIYAVTEPGKAAKSFREYLQEFRAQPTDIFFGYNNWWTTPVHLNNDMMVDLAKTVKRELWDKHGVAPDVFTLDLGWSDPHSIWKINKERFPNGFSEIKKVLDEMGTGIGFWISPCSAYPDGLDNNWARDAEYEVFKGDHHIDCNLCMGGKRYSDDFIKNAGDSVGVYQVKHIKFDAYAYHCPSRDHGHLPGAYSAEPIAQRMIDFYEAARSASPDIRLNAPQLDRDTIYIGDEDSEPLLSRIPPDNRSAYLQGSPWWLKHMHVMANVAGDYPFGQVPAPVYRDSYTTVRSFRVLQSALDPIIPLNCQEVFGIINQSEELLVGDAVDVLMRGHQFIGLYVNPDKTDQEGWEFIAKIIGYGHGNKRILRNTTALFPESWKQPDGSYRPGPRAMRNPYGYVHADGERALVYLRNPWIAEQTRTLRLDETSGFPNNGFVWNAVSVFPYRRTYARDLRYGDEISVHLQPYQNVIIEFSAAKPTAPEARKTYGVSASDIDCNIEKIRAKAPRRLGKGSAKAAIKCSVQADHEVNKLMVLVETAQEAALNPEVEAVINGERLPVDLIASKDGWSADSGPPPENWTWHVVLLPRGASAVDLAVSIHSTDAELSVWLWGESAVADPGQTPLPHPKPVDRESVQILAPTPV